MPEKILWQSGLWLNLKNCLPFLSWTLGNAGHWFTRINTSHPWNTLNSALQSLSRLWIDEGLLPRKKLRYRNQKERQWLLASKDKRWAAWLALWDSLTGAMIRISIKVKLRSSDLDGKELKNWEPPTLPPQHTSIPPSLSAAWADLRALGLKLSTFCSS